MGVYGATIGLAVAFGPLVGGALVEGIGWESIFFLNVPIGIAALAITYTHAAGVARPERLPHRLGRAGDLLDWPCSCSCSGCCAATRRAGARP